MKAALYTSFGSRPTLEELDDPSPEPDGVVVRVKATGICRSDWHGWMGHDPDVSLPHVPGHELAGVIEEIGASVERWKIGDRVTVPFVGGCGVCPQCESGNQQVCDFQFQPGFTHWGSFASRVAIGYADVNLVGLPEKLDFVEAASLGCRFATSFRAVVDQGRLAPGEWVAIHGCGGVGLSALMIARALEARVVAIDISEEALAMAESLGAEIAVDSRSVDDVPAAIREATDGGAHLSLDALGSPGTCLNSVLCLRKRGRHVQVGLMPSGHGSPELPMDRVIAHELEILGSHGMQAHRYGRMLEMILDGRLQPGRLVRKTVDLAESIEVLMNMDRGGGPGVTVIDRFGDR